MSEAKNLYLLMARDVTTDSQDNMNSVLKIIDRFNTTLDNSELKKSGLEFGKDILTMPINYSFASSWYFGKNVSKGTKVKVQFSVEDPEGRDLEGPTQEFELPSAVNRLAVNINAQGLPFTAEGEYTLHAELSISGRRKLEADYPFEVVVQWQENAKD